MAQLNVVSSLVPIYSETNAQIDKDDDFIRKDTILRGRKEEEEKEIAFEFLRHGVVAVDGRLGLVVLFIGMPRGRYFWSIPENDDG